MYKYMKKMKFWQEDCHNFWGKNGEKFEKKFLTIYEKNEILTRLSLILRKKGSKTLGKNTKLYAEKWILTRKMCHQFWGKNE